MDWVAFLTDHDIPYVTRGPNTKKGEISVKCPWCGDDDPSEHLGISLTTTNWGCHRNATHRGRTTHRLISGLTGLGTTRAKGLVAAYSRPDVDTLGAALAALTGISEAPKPLNGHEVLKYPTEFRSIKSVGNTVKFWNYLYSRHFDDVDDLIARYGLLCCLTGRWANRVIIPFHKGKKLVGWTGRALTDPIIAPRYLSSSQEVKKHCFNQDELMDGGRVLFITEGPFDALKLDYYGEPFKARATCLFGISMSSEQLCTLMDLRRRFRKVVILLDRAAVEATFQVADWLQGPNVTIGSLPDGVKDPGVMKRKEVDALIKGEL